MTDLHARAKQLALELVCDGNPVLWERYGHCKSEVAAIESALREQIEACAKVASSHSCVTVYDGTKPDPFAGGHKLGYNEAVFEIAAAIRAMN